MVTRIHKLDTMPVLHVRGVKFICPEISITGDDPIYITERLARYVNRMTRETNYDVHVFHRGENIDSCTERKKKFYAQYAIAAPANEPGFVLVQTSLQGLVKINIRTGEGRTIK